MAQALKIGLIVLGGLVFAFLAGYILFSYFSKDNQPTTETQQAETPVEVESDYEGIEPIEGSVAGVSTEDTTGISSSSAGTPAPVTYSTPDSEGIEPTIETPETTTITPEMHEEAKEEANENNVTYVEADDGNDDSEVSANQTPEVNEQDDYIEYIYRFFFNDDARDRYEDGFSYYIDSQSCDDSDYFTSSSYDFSGTVDDVDEEVEIKVRIEKAYIDDSNDFEDSEYKLDGELYIVEGDVNVPVCED